MKKNEKYDKVIANFDLHFIKNKFDNDNVAAPESLNGENVKNALDDKEQKIIPFVKTKAFKTAVSLVACVCCRFSQFCPWQKYAIAACDRYRNSK